MSYLQYIRSRLRNEEITSATGDIHDSLGYKAAETHDTTKGTMFFIPLVILLIIAGCIYQFRRDLWNNYFNNMYDPVHDNYKKIAFNNLVGIKLGLCILFLLITIIYQSKYSKIRGAKTMLSYSSDWWRVLLDGVIAGVIGAISASLVFMNRGESPIKHKYGILTVALILFLFTFAQEGSGLNRYLESDHAKHGKGYYGEVDIADKDSVGIIRGQGDPFLDSLSTLAVMIVIFMFLCLSIIMLIAAHAGWDSEKYDLPKVFSDSKHPYLRFLVEWLIFVVGLNVLPPIIAQYLRREPEHNIFTPIMIAIIALGLHPILHYTGNLDFTNKINE